MLRLNTAKNTYNELQSNINKYESMEDFLSENSFAYDSVIYYICDCLEIECDDEVFRYLDNAITDEITFEELYKEIHSIAKSKTNNIFNITFYNDGSKVEDIVDKMYNAMKSTGISEMKHKVDC